MIKVIVFAVIGLVLGLGGGSGFAVMRAKKALVIAADSMAKKDSASGSERSPSERTKAAEGEGAHAVARDSAGVATETSKHDSAAIASSEKTSAAAVTGAPSVAAPGALPKTAVVAKTPLVDSAHAGAPVVPGRIAKIFAAMSAKDAARVLQQMDDADVQTVLGGLNERQAAAILAGFPADRAAAISRAAIRGKKGSS